MQIIRTRNLTKKFGKLTAVDSLNLSVNKGEIFGLVGPDGAGKTTTMRLLCGIMDPTDGEAYVAGHSAIEEPETIKDKIGYMSQKFGLYADLTVIENINFYADIYQVSKSERKVRIDRLFEFSQLEPFKNRLVGNLSGGMKQKLGLTCALVHTPEVLFLDEPTTGVDPVSRRDFWRILYQLLGEKVTIFVSTPYMDEAERCNRVALIHDGKLVVCDTPDDIKKLMKGELIELTCDDPRRAKRVIENLDEVFEVAIFGDRLHISVPAFVTSKHKILESLESEAIGVSDIRKIAPSFEDVFISLV